MIIIRIVNWNIPEEKKPQIRKIVRKGLIFLAILAGLFILTRTLGITLDDILRYTPENPFLAGLLMLAFYGLKSLTVFFPVPLLMIASGHLFSTGLALVVNFLGIAVLHCPDLTSTFKAVHHGHPQIHQHRVVSRPIL